MSSDEGINDYNHSTKSHYHQQLSPKKLHHQQLSIHNDGCSPSNHHLGIASASTQTNNCCDINGVVNNSTIKRRKSTSNVASNQIIAIPSKTIQSIDNGYSDHQSHSNDDDSCSASSHILSSTSPPIAHNLQNQMKSANSTAINNSYHQYNLSANSHFSDGTNSTSSIIKNSSMASPSRYLQHDYLQGNTCLPNSNRLSVHQADMYDAEMTTCCLPPPSPAPNSDRFIMGIPSPSISVNQHHHHHQTNQSQHQRYKNTMSDRYREVSSKCDRYLPPPHYLANSTPLSSSNISMVGGTNSIVTNSADSYVSGYLSSTVHTPVKRYVPSTNTIATDIYSDSTNMPQLTTMQQQQQQQQIYNSHSSHLPQLTQSHAHSTPRNSSQSNTNTLTSSYRYRMKCCSNLENSQNLINNEDVLSNAYATQPRTRQLSNTKLTMSSVGSSKSLVSTCSASSNIPSSLSGKSGSSSLRSSVRNLQPNGEHFSDSSSIDYCTSNGSSSVINSSNLNVSNSYNAQAFGTPSAIIPTNTINNSASNTGNGTCLHCSTIRRSTGVHQTTQTGPVSPIPQNINGKPVFLGFTESGDYEKIPNNSGPVLRDFQQQSHMKISPTQTQSHQQMISQENNMAAQQQHQQQQQQHHQQQQQPQQQQLSMLQQPQQPHNMHHQNQAHMQISPTQSQSHQQLDSQDSLVQSQMAEESDQLSHSSRKQKIKQYVKREVAKFFGVDLSSEERERVKWSDRQKRLALRRFGSLKPNADLMARNQIEERQKDRPDILPVDHVPSAQHHYCRDNLGSGSLNNRNNMNSVRRHTLDGEIDIDDDDDDDDDAELENRNAALNQHLIIERKASVSSLLWLGLQYAVHAFSKKVAQNQRQWSRSFAPQYLNNAIQSDSGISDDTFDGVALPPLQENELFFDSPSTNIPNNNGVCSNNGGRLQSNQQNERSQNGWRTRTSDSSGSADILGNQQVALTQQQQSQQQQQAQRLLTATNATYRGTRISSQMLDGVLDNSRRPTQQKLKLLHVHELDDRYDHRPYFTYWINTVQILVLFLTLICYGFGPVGIGMEQKNGQVLVTSLSLQQVQHQEPRNIWIGPRGDDLVHLGAKFAACMRRDLKILDVMAKTRRQERETACCIRNDDSGCVQSSQADCSVRGLWPTKSISTWKKWSPGESGPGGRISGSVCGLDPKYCDAPASIAPYEWPDDITKWPICRKTNSFSQRFRYKDHTAEHMVCEVIGHPCCISVYGECRITTREFCDFVNGYFHEEASLCSQVSCLNDICGMFPFISPDIPDQFYRLFTSLCLHAGVIHLAITVAFQHIFLTDLERLLGPIRTAILYIGSGVAGNLISAIFLPYKPEVGPLASIAGVVSSMTVLLVMIHWKQLKRPHMALMKLIFLAICIFAIGTLPWQQHIVGLLGGILCGTFLTLTMVPFLSITKYGRKAKIKLVWTCILLHFLIYATLFILFYLFPMALSSIGWWGTDSTNIHNPYNGAIGGSYSVGGNIVACDNNKGMQCGGTSSNQPGGIVRSAINI